MFNQFKKIVWYFCCLSITSLFFYSEGNSQNLSNCSNQLITLQGYPNGQSVVFNGTINLMPNCGCNNIGKCQKIRVQIPDNYSCQGLTVSLQNSSEWYNDHFDLYFLPSCVYLGRDNDLNAQKSNYIISINPIQQGGVFEFLLCAGQDLPLSQSTVDIEIGTSDLCVVNNNPNCTHPDFNALVDLYNATGGSSWTVKTGWQAGSASTNCDVCNWFGVKCKNGRVEELILTNNNLEGQLPNSIGQLNALKRLELTNNKLNGSIPSTIGQLSKLKFFLLSKNKLSGNVPASIGQLKEVTWFYIYDNQLSGEFPPQICEIKRLIQFAIYKNKFTGVFPECMSSLPVLGRIYASDNMFSGSLPKLGGINQPTLKDLHFANNQFTGNIPNEYTLLPGLKFLEIANNQLSGCYPSGLRTKLCPNPENINSKISQGNYFDLTWSQFCSNSSGGCN